MLGDLVGIVIFMGDGTRYEIPRAMIASVELISRSNWGLAFKIEGMADELHRKVPSSTLQIEEPKWEVADD